MARRSIKGHIEEGRRWFRADRRREAAVDMSITELRYFYERIEGGEHPVEPLCDMFLFAFAVGYRAGARGKGKCFLDGKAAVECARAGSRK